MPPKDRKTTEAEAAVKRIMVALVAEATSGSTPISSISGPCMGPQQCGTHEASSEQSS